MHRTFPLLLIIMLAISSLSLTLLTVKPTGAQTIPIPSVPQFTVQYVVYTYYIAPTYTINPYTGQNVTASSGAQMQNQTIQFTVINQPFTPYTNSNGSYIGLYYNFRCKGHFGTQWTYFPFAQTQKGTWQSTWRYDELGNMTPEYPATSSQYTTVAIGLPFLNLQNNAQGGQVDFQVQALIGDIEPINSGVISGEGIYSFTGQSSDWSNNQTITIDYNSNSTISTQSTPSPTSTTTTLSPTPTSSPTVPELSLLTVIPLLVGVLFVAVKLRHWKINYD